MFKTVNLTGGETVVTGLGGHNTALQNLGSYTVYASAKSGITPEADGVCAIPAGGSVIIPDTRGTIYLYGEGIVQLNGTDWQNSNFKQPPSDGGSGGGTGGGVSQVYVDRQDALTLTKAQAYTDAELKKLIVFSTYREFPNQGSENVLYIDKGENKFYLWNAEKSIYTEIAVGSDWSQEFLAEDMVFNVGIENFQ